jgi:hypothetical protein
MGRGVFRSSWWMRACNPTGISGLRVVLVIRTFHIDSKRSKSIEHGKNRPKPSFAVMSQISSNYHKYIPICTHIN